MTIRKKIKNILTNEDLTIKGLAENLSQKKGTKINTDSISQKLLRDSIKYKDVEEILDILGYDIVFVKRKNL